MHWRVLPAREVCDRLPTLATWHHAEWSTYFPGWTTADALQELQANARSTGPVPTTLVALAESGGALLGSVSLVDEDSPDLRAFDGPWLASLFVAPSARGHGLGEALVRAIVTHASQSGIARVRLFTPHHRGFYERLGWRFEARASSGGEPVDVMAIAP
ncbi:MAG: GNAT family N-acetyltransferase [Silanimonas sp.]